MARIVLFIVAAAAILGLLWVMFSGIIHLVLIAFWVVLIAVLGFGLFRIGRWSGSRRQSGPGR
jgi:hypothetical protein